MRIGTMAMGAEAAGVKTARGINNPNYARGYTQAAADNTSTVAGSRLFEMMDKGSKNKEGEPDEEDSVSMAEKVYQAAISGKRNPLEELRHKPGVPYEHLAKDGVIEYNGVTFVCDYEKNCICLGDMSDESNVLTIALSGGGSLKVNRNNIGELSKAAGMFSPEDLNLIMRAIAQDNKARSMEKELEDMEESVGNNLQEESQAETE